MSLKDKQYRMFNKQFLLSVMHIFIMGFSSAVLAGPLHEATINGDLEIMKKLIIEGSNVNEFDENDNSPLHIAASTCNNSAIELLLSNGANLNVIDKNNTTALFYPALMGCVETVEYLLKLKIKNEKPNKFGNTPLTLAIDKGNVGVVSIIKKYKGIKAIDSDLVKVTQRRLQLMDYYKGKVDVVSENELKKAIQLFQSDIGVQTSGILTNEILSQLEEASQIDSSIKPVTIKANLYLRNTILFGKYQWVPGKNRITHIQALGIMKTLSDVKFGVSDPYELGCSGAGTLVHVESFIVDPPPYGGQHFGVESGAYNYSGHFRLGNLEIKGCATQSKDGILFKKGTEIIFHDIKDTQ